MGEAVQGFNHTGGREEQGHEGIRLSAGRPDEDCAVRDKVHMLMARCGKGEQAAWRGIHAVVAGIADCLPSDRFDILHMRVPDSEELHDHIPGGQGV